MLIRILTEEKFEELDDAKKALYEKRADGKYHLVLDGDDGEDLRRAKEHEKTRRQEAEEKARKLQEEKDEAERQRQEAEEAAAKKKGDVEALEKSWKAKLDAAVAAEKARADKLDLALKKSLVNEVAAKIAGDISTAPALLTDHIAKRLSFELLEDGTAVQRVLDGTGRPSAASLDDLKKEFVDNPTFAAIIKASDASGGGANGGDNGGGAPNSKKISEMTATEEAKFANTDPEGYARQCKAEGIAVS